ncbi:hypothetical protein [Mycobacterium colombiense]|uniref:hypothetical protein n=1 Tax=Mycobacterium colombiense TaxID=339268 RepID=UPI00096F395C|nr:hypothetical protein [Mycobacterium colombiense]OMB95669.1 hypothetical protein A5732_10970 [Mycobacterium colombiense]
MVREEGGRWDVGIQNNAVYVARISESDKRIFDDSISPEEARDLAGLLTKFATKLEESADSDTSEESEESKESKKSRDDEDSEDDKESKDDEDSSDDEDSEDDKDSKDEDSKDDEASDKSSD